MRLFEHPDFEQAILQAAEFFREQGLRPAIIEKDYYVTETLHSLAATAAGTASAAISNADDNTSSTTINTRIIFKGGTSLSKGWNLIQRFSEDIDIFLDPLAFEPPLGKRGIDRELKNLRDAIAGHPGLTYVAGESQTIGGFGRNDRFSYLQRFGGPGEVANRVLLEAGTASGREPTATVEISSYVGQFLTNKGITLGAEDEAPFFMRLLHFRRTFVEKLFAIHGKVELLKRDGQPLGSYARHYYDLFQLAAQPEVSQMLRSGEYAAIKEDYDRISREHFERSYFCPEGMSFASSNALFPSAGLAAVLGNGYEAQCRLLCYGHYPGWPQVLARFEELRQAL
ncbi:MAG: nucleotidyl transferase AbiEii/AbiGii toxin family protein [Bryobacterales bacterium]|nr:nucleotidyl transferase AbiEii/AbiGii toxin family protein [Bryobacterales bacterium]